MTAETQYRLLKSNPHIVTVQQALDLLEPRIKVIEKRQRDSTTIKLEHEIFLAEARDCNKILKEIECQ